MPVRPSTKEDTYIIKADAEAYRQAKADGKSPMNPTIFKIRTLPGRHMDEVKNLLMQGIDMDALKKEILSKNAKKKSGGEDSEIDETAAVGANTFACKAAANRYAVSRGIVGWSNFFDEDGNPVVYTSIDGAMSPESLDALIECEVVEELADAVIERNRVTMADLGN
jgi:hypothetical protein